MMLAGPCLDLKIKIVAGGEPTPWRERNPLMQAVRSNASKLHNHDTRFRHALLARTRVAAFELLWVVAQVQRADLNP